MFFIFFSICYRKGNTKRRAYGCHARQGTKSAELRNDFQQDVQEGQEFHAAAKYKAHYHYHHCYPCRCSCTHNNIGGVRLYHRPLNL